MMMAICSQYNHLSTIVFLCITFFASQFTFTEGNTNTDECVGRNSPVSKSYLATKTAYAASEREDSWSNQFENEVSSHQCEVQQLWLLTRHGSRYPLKKEIAKMLSTLPLIAQEVAFNAKEGRGCLSESEVQELEQFVPSYSPRDGAQLHEAGADEQYALGQFWRNKFPQLFKQDYSPQNYKVEFTTANRTGQSAYHFLRGVFGDDQVARIQLPSPRKPNYKLRAYKTCPAYTRDVKEDPATLQEQRLYEQSEEFTGTERAVSARLGYTEPMPLDELLLVYDECRYETSWWPETDSVWCKVFTEQDGMVLEHHQTLRYYYEDSYGGPPINAQLPCATVTDLYTYLRNAAEDVSASPRVVLYFSHNKMVLQLLASMGLHRPARPVTHNREQGQEFSSSRLVPFSANVAFALYRCSGGSHRVGGFLQGVPTTLSPLCPSSNTVTCPWPLELEEPDNCNVRALCRLHDEL